MMLINIPVKTNAIPLFIISNHRSYALLRFCYFQAASTFFCLLCTKDIFSLMQFV
uniref:Uncharacterized protein n=1 Tax=Arundo donax TaxID=35708 RepID=A0A0A8YXN9_ARUDO